MTDTALANDIVYSVMVDPTSALCVARHAELGPALGAGADPEPAEPAAPVDPETLTDEQKRAMLSAGIRARGEDPIARAVSV
jgi:hypothetical protein